MAADSVFIYINPTALRQKQIYWSKLIMTHAREKNHNKKKGLLILLALLTAIGIITGSIFAFFSDIVTGSTTITAGTLDLVKGTGSGAPAIIEHYNAAGVKQPASSIDDVISNFNPGDRAVIKMAITNEGSKSAWLRGQIELTGTAVSFTNFANFNDIIKVYKGDFGTAGVGGQTALTLTTDSGKILWTESPAVDIIDGDPAKTDPEDDNGAAGLQNTVTLSYTITFDTAADNTWQDKVLAFNFAVQAVQYRNNSAKSWTDAVTVPFGS
jgi:hypothetical protein